MERLLARGVAMSAKAFAMGVRIEHPQDDVDLIQYGRVASSCGVMPADYKMTAQTSGGRGVYTFCMCPGGEVIACSSEAGGVVTNGMSRYKRASGFANSGLVVQTHLSDFAAEPGPGGPPRRRLPAARRAGRVRGRRRDLRRPGDPRHRLPLGARAARAAARDLHARLRPGRLDAVYPAPYLEALAEALRFFDRKMRGFVSEEAVLVAPESRTSSPVRIERNEACESPSLPGLFPAGEGAGFAGGIVSAALDGLRVARAVRARLAGETPPPSRRRGPVSGPEY